MHEAPENLIYTIAHILIYSGPLQNLSHTAPFESCALALHSHKKPTNNRQFKKCSSNNEPSYFFRVVRGCLGNYQTGQHAHVNT